MLVLLAISISTSSDIADALVKVLPAGTRPSYDAVRKRLSSLIARQRELTKAIPQLLQMTFARTVNSYLTYIDELTREVLIAMPVEKRVPVSKRRTRNGKLQPRKDSSLAQIEELTYQLSFGGMRERSKRLSNSYGVVLYTRPETLDVAARYVEYRNAIVHNRGLVSQKTIDRIGDTGLIVGQPVPLDDDTLEAAWKFFLLSAYDIDLRVADRFELPRPAKAQIRPAR